MSELKPCPRCGTKAYLSRDVVDGFYFGWSAGCPRYCHYDGIHGTTIDTSEEDCYAVHGANSKEEASSGTRRRRTRAISDRVEEETLYKNKEGYCDPTAGKAIQDASRIPHHVKEAHKALKDIASLLGFEILVLRDRKTGRVYRWKQ